MISIDAIHELELKFIKPIPKSDLNLSEVLVSNIEPAFWYYEDILRTQNPEYHNFKTFRSFSQALFLQSEILANLNVDFPREFSAYKRYRSQVPLCGGILLNELGDKVLLVRDFNSMSWMFPRGKKIPGESDMDCAVREVMEETSFDITGHVNEKEYLSMKANNRDLKLFLVRNVPESFKFRPQTRKEISGLKFFSFDAIPTNSFHVRPLLEPLLRWLHSNYNSHNNDNNISPSAAACTTTNTTTASSSKKHFNVFDSFQLDVKKILHAIDLAFESTIS